MDAAGNHSDGPGRPDLRLTRLDRLRQARSWGYSGPVSGFGAASIAGFDPVGQVFGTTVMYLGSMDFGACFVPVTGSAASVDLARASEHNPLVEQLGAARAVALENAVAECRALGGDGIIGVRMSVVEFLSDTVKFSVEGTAVRARSRIRPGAPFTTHVSGQELAKLLHSGWMPFALVYGIAIASCHFDASMFQQTRRRVGEDGNQEVSGYTRLVNDARRAARRALEATAVHRGAEGTVAQELTLHFTERECPRFDQRSDYMAEATILGSALVSFERGAPAGERAPLAIMRLDRNR